MNNYSFKTKSDFSLFAKLPIILTQKLIQPIEISLNGSDIKLFQDDYEILLGQLSHTADDRTTIVKIFLSSTFSDFKHERNILYSYSFPRLKAHCASIDLDFQWVDMRWGVTKQLTKQNITEELCLNEIRNCKRISCGPNFVCFVGNRYGARSLPSKISKELFEQIIEIVDHDKLNLINKWYRLDLNNQPSEYILLMPDEANESDASWRDDEPKLQKILQHAAEKCNISKEEKDIFFLSVTEKEINEGLNDNQNSRILCFLREFKEINHEDSKAIKFSDLKYDAETKTLVEDTSTVTYLANLKTRLNLFGLTHLKQYSIDWADGGINTNTNKSHDEYLKQFAEDFTQECINSIDSLIRDSNLSSQISQSKSFIYGKVTNSQINLNAILDEAKHHSSFCQYKLKSYVERDFIVKNFKSYLSSQNRNKPFCLHSNSGCGKTSILACLAKKLFQNEFKDVGIVNPAVIFRFLGTTVTSFNIQNLLENLCDQIQIIYEEIDVTKTEWTTSTDNNYTLDSLVVKFHNLLKVVSHKMRVNTNSTPYKAKNVQSENFRKPLIIILDSIDQLSPLNGAHELNWLPSTLPPNIMIIFSCITNFKNILTKYKLRYAVASHKDFIYELPLVDEKFSIGLIKHYLHKKGRTVTKEQLDFLINKSIKTQNTLYIKLIIDSALKWKSFSTNENLFTNFPNNPNEAINELFNKLEINYGKMLVRYSLGYLTVSQSGLSDVELEDLLSINNEVLNEVYEYHDPPVESIIRIPSLLWSRIKYELSEYLIEKQINSKPINYWYHRIFYECAYERYCSKAYEELNLHLAVYYMNTDGVRKDILLTKRNNLLIKDADRMVTKHPLIKSNKRKLECLPYYLAKAKNHDLLAQCCLVNFEFLLCKLIVFGLNYVLLDYTNLNQMSPQIEVIYKFLTYNEVALKQDPYALISLLIGQLENIHDFSYLNQMIIDAENSCINGNRFFPKKLKILLPLCKCLSTTNRMIKWYYEGYNRVLCTSKNSEILICIKQTDPPIIPYKAPLIVIGHGKHKEVGIVNIKTLSVSKLLLNSNANLMSACLLSDESNSNLLYILFDNIIGVYDLQRLVLVTNVDIRWKQQFYLNKLLYFFEDETYFLLANEERIMLREHCINTEKLSTIDNWKMGNLKQLNSINNYLANERNKTWEIRNWKFPSKNDQRSDIKGIEYGDTLLLITKETSTKSYIYNLSMWKEGMKLKGTHEFDSLIGSYCKVSQEQLVLGFSNNTIKIFNIIDLTVINSINFEDSVRKISINGNHLIVQDKKLHFFDKNNFIEKSTLEMDERLLWLMSNENKFLVKGNSTGYIEIYSQKEQNTFKKIQSFQISSTAIDNLFIFESHLATISNDLLINIIDLSMVDSNQSRSEESLREIPKYSSIIFGLNKCIKLLTEKNAVILNYKSVDTGNLIELENSVGLKGGVFNCSDNRYFIGYNKSSCFEWFLENGRRITTVYECKEEIIKICMEKSKLLILTKNTILLWDLNNNNRTLIKNKSHSWTNINRVDLALNERFLIVSQIIPENELSTLLAYDLDTDLVTQCQNGEVKPIDTLKTLPMFCSSNKQIYIPFKGAVLTWNPLKAKTATYYQINDFRTYLKHSIRLYNDIKDTDDLIKSEITTFTCTTLGDVCFTGDQCGYIVVWYNKQEQLNNKKVYVTNHEGIYYGYFIFKEHSNRVNLLQTCDERNLLFSASNDRSLKIWSFISKNPHLITSIYTHMLINEIYFDSKEDKLIANGEKLGENQFLAFSLLTIKKLNK